MIQSVKFDSLDMNIKKITQETSLFIVRRLTEISGILILVAGVFLFISLFTYSAEDPNFIFPENTEIKNLLGVRGSYISDLFFQSIGLIAYLFSLTIIFMGLWLLVLKKKDLVYLL